MLCLLPFSGPFFRYAVSAALVFLVPMPLLVLLLVLVPEPSAGVLPIRTRRHFVVAQLGFRTVWLPSGLNPIGLCQGRKLVRGQTYF